MKKYILIMAIISAMVTGCQNPATEEKASQTGQSDQTTQQDEFKWQTEQFADIKIIRYQVPGFDKLTLKQKKLVYFLTQAGLSGRDIMWDMNYRHNLTIRRALENILKNYTGDKESEDWKNFMTYTKRVWFS
jgi:dipeptidyl-peptidase III